MAAIPRQTLTDAIDAEELKRPEAQERLNACLWLLVGIWANDVINPTPALQAQLRVMFPEHDWPRTRRNLDALFSET